MSRLNLNLTTIVPRVSALLVGLAFALRSG